MRFTLSTLHFCSSNNNVTHTIPVKYVVNNNLYIQILNKIICRVVRLMEVIILLRVGAAFSPVSEFVVWVMDEAVGGQKDLRGFNV